MTGPTVLRGGHGATCLCPPTAWDTRALLRELAAGFDVRAPIIDALGAIHRALADDFREHEVGDGVDLARLQCRRRIGHLQLGRSDVGLLEAVAAPVAVSELVERR